MKPTVAFKAYDIRGRADTGEVDAQLYELTGNAFARLLAAPVIAVGRDCRPTSQHFFEALAHGMTTAGADVIDLGEVPTDVVYYYSGAKGVPGAMITASHNPGEYNGLKLCRPGAAPVGEETGLLDIRKAVMERKTIKSSLPGSINTEDPLPGFIDHIFSIVAPKAVGPLEVAVDAGNGMAGVVLGRVFDNLDATMDGLYLEPDGTFPNHPADPLVPENLADLVAKVDSGRYDLGVAFDGDADRAFFLDDRGEPLSGSTVTSLIARKLLERHPGSVMVHNLITSKAVSEIIEESGGIPVRTRVGHSFIKGVMAERGALFGGEHSGHYYFQDNYYADSGMIAMLLLLAILTEEGRPLSEVRREVERYSASGEVNFEVANTREALAHVEESVYNASVDHMDGLTVDYGEAWFNLRPSNTEPLLRLNVEAGSEEKVQEIVERVERILREQK